MSESHVSKREENRKSIPYARYGYAGFVVLGLYMLVFTHEWMIGVSNLGIALIFDPFDQKVSWSDRPLYQRIWLIVHLVLIASLLVYGLFIR
ncbi:MAG: hypothetical protein KGO92_09735 [Bacteroidota bacterium]|nr:hypothetical protein [Bacteroidota bacterium]